MSHPKKCDELFKLGDHRLAICLGQRTDMPLSKINKYRELWGLAPIVRHDQKKSQQVFRQQANKNATQGQRPGRTCSGCQAGGFLGRAKKRVANLAKSVVNFVADGMEIASPEQQQTRLNACASCPLNVNGWCDDTQGGCGCNIALKVQARAAACPSGRWFAHGDRYRPLVNPTRNLIFHIYPKRGAEWNWHWHIEQIRRFAPAFNGAIAIGIGTGPNLVNPDEVKRVMDGIPVTHWVVKPNGPTAELTTFPDLLSIVKTDDPNAVTFRGHCKGVTKTTQSIEQYWARMMWATCMDLPSVDDALASHLMAGPLKCHEPLVSKYRYAWFYAGTFFWFRNREIFERDWNTHEQTRWWIEQWPGVICSNAEAACLCHDFTDGSVLREKYWNTVVKPSVELWQRSRPHVMAEL